MYRTLLDALRKKPDIYTPGVQRFWDDEYISEQMLKAHLDPEIDAASRNHAFIRRSAKWISQFVEAGREAKLLDLGCGPGLYANIFADQGFKVTGIDLSRRSIEYAKQHVGERKINYYCQNYLDLDFENEFDLAVLIYCDLGVIPPDRRLELLRKIKKALKPEGLFIFDVWTDLFLEELPESQSIEYEKQGFWSPRPYACVHRVFHYPDTLNYLEQYVVITEEECRCYHIWNQCYTSEMLLRELQTAGFDSVSLFGDVCGVPLEDGSKTMCAVAK